MVSCFHCGDTVPPDEHRTVRIDDKPRPVCCIGCQAAATFIRDAGLDDFYRYRTAPTPQPEDGGRDEWSLLDDGSLQQDFVEPLDDGRGEARLLIEGISCAACSWLIEHALTREEGVEQIRVNPASGRALLRWDAARRPLSELLRLIAALGFTPHPVGSEAAAGAAERERSRALKRLAVAGLGMMQVMMYAVALYLGAVQAMEPLYQDFLRLVSLLVATPVLFYAGAPFFQGATRDLRARRPGMDVPVALAMGGAYAWSLWVTFRGGEEVYFDSVTMFIFFLSLGRYAEMAARHRAGALGEALSQLLPASALRLQPDGTEQRIAARHLRVGDVVIIAPGESVPADGVVIAGQSRLDESMLSGESEPLPRGTGARLVGGSLNLEHPLRMRVEQVGADTVVSAIGRLLERAAAERPRLAQTAERVGRVFVIAVLVVAALIALVWWQIDPSRALPVVLATLVVTCPCALSLATPTALTAATTRLARDGLLISRPDTLENLARVDRLVLDKTGTLTRGQLRITETLPLGAEDESACLNIAAQLEQGSEHPLARAFPRAPRAAEEQRYQPGAGVQGRVDGQRYRIGRADYVAALAGPPPAGLPADALLLGGEQGWLAAFRLADQLRPEAAVALDELRGLGLRAAMASGDAAATVAAVARQLRIDEHAARLDPAQKLERLAEYRRRGELVAMIGDGVNDAPVLAGADVSIAMGGGTALARASSDAVLLREDLRLLPHGVRLARRTLRIIHQNMAWALGYNLIGLPLAAVGLVPPWLAAIGMSASSLIVVLNSLRLGRAARNTPLAAAGVTEART
ncbi:heavy metal translocating P-type ATPase [Alkalilimnicola sp. S0819]|uniref:heavy metal translocating P-type ATPase n=1 Tax=Alkalilimnicola sp. S0819 TaxID=2613922 RepID=UPI001261AE26|nr:heavy metal translocating P-type ATPase [Alkalilimnicola sp. S0819]KAB7628196.1 cadmium-translocating P-type ATPase [Alkalilimnicola sp. S0819]MPQ15085.1 cadmium-translocating P-type ATPase [Alkalilimnicola sp. S0819]